MLSQLFTDIIWFILQNATRVQTTNTIWDDIVNQTQSGTGADYDSVSSDEVFMADNNAAT